MILISTTGFTPIGPVRPRSRKLNHLVVSYPSVYHIVVLDKTSSVRNLCKNNNKININKQSRGQVNNHYWSCRTNTSGTQNNSKKAPKRHPSGSFWAPFPYLRPLIRYFWAPFSVHLAALFAPRMGVHPRCENLLVLAPPKASQGPPNGTRIEYSPIKSLLASVGWSYCVWNLAGPGWAKGTWAMGAAPPEG